MPEDTPARLTIHPPDHLSIPLPNGQAVDILQFHYFVNSAEIERQAHEQPLLVQLPIEVNTENGTWRSGGPQWILFGHGYRNAQREHVLEPNGQRSEDIVTAVSTMMAQADPNQRLRLFIACDGDNAPLRWDEGQKGRVLGVIGMGGGVNRARTENRMLIIDATHLPDNVFSNPQHPNRFLLNPPHFTYKPKGKITIR